MNLKKGTEEAKGTSEASAKYFFRTEKSTTFLNVFL